MAKLLIRDLSITQQSRSYSGKISACKNPSQHSQSVTPGNVHDSQKHDTLLLGYETALYADAAYSSKQTRETLAKLGIEDQVQRKGYRGKPLSKGERTRNKEIAVTRAGGERPFATYKRHDGLARTRFMGLAKNTTLFGLAAMEANIRKGTQFLLLYGVPKICSAG
ncbi:MAG: transposase [Endozoicomonadaceae bacterium]|nr:transposase [Endozoicomonadaceae bacterium]